MATVMGLCAARRVSLRARQHLLFFVGRFVFVGLLRRRRRGRGRALTCRNEITMTRILSS
jgi:hypothetical protein